MQRVSACRRAALGQLSYSDSRPQLINHVRLRLLLMLMRRACMPWPMVSSATRRARRSSRRLALATRVVAVAQAVRRPALSTRSLLLPRPPQPHLPAYRSQLLVSNAARRGWRWSTGLALVTRAPAARPLPWPMRRVEAMERAHIPHRVVSTTARAVQRSSCCQRLMALPLRLAQLLEDVQVAPPRWTVVSRATSTWRSSTRLALVSRALTATPLAEAMERVLQPLWMHQARRPPCRRRTGLLWVMARLRRPVVPTWSVQRELTLWSTSLARCARLQECSVCADAPGLPWPAPLPQRWPGLATSLARPMHQLRPPA